MKTHVRQIFHFTTIRIENYADSTKFHFLNCSLSPSLVLTVGMYLVVLHAIVLAGKPGFTQRPWANVFTLASMCTIVTS